MTVRAAAAGEAAGEAAAGPGAHPGIRPFGDEALLVEVDSLAEAIAAHRALEGALLPGVVELVPAARTVLVSFDRTRTTAVALTARIAGIVSDLATAPSPAGSGVRVAAGRRTRPVSPVVIRVRYDGPDLAEVAATLGLGADALVAEHTGRLWTVAFSGFAPGFGYLVDAGIPSGDGEGAAADPGAASARPWPSIPRLAVPRTRVPAGSVGLAGEFSGVYPRASPGGWQLIGTTDSVLWDVERPEPALLVPGALVRFEAR